MKFNNILIKHSELEQNWNKSSSANFYWMKNKLGKIEISMGCTCCNFYNIPRAYRDLPKVPEKFICKICGQEMNVRFGQNFIDEIER